MLTIVQGLSFIIEALLGGKQLAHMCEVSELVPLTGIHDHLLEEMGQDPREWLDTPEAQWAKLMKMVSTKQPVLVGHNLIYDLCFLHTMFIGPLPDTLAGFQGRIRELFPRIVDTKVLDSQTVDPDIVDLDLTQIFLRLRVQTYPVVEGTIGWSYPWGQQGPSTSAHNAGYDSKYSKRLGDYKLR